MPTLSWIGKDKAINRRQQASCRVLTPSCTRGEVDSGYMLINGDNLHGLPRQGLMSRRGLSFRQVLENSEGTMMEVF
jgi:hypothetical protein